MIYIKSKIEIEGMRDAGKLAAELLYETGKRVMAGVSTQELNDFAETFTRSRKAISAPLNYRGFPKSICTSVNHVVCHGIPNKDHILKDGDIVNIDVTPIYRGFHGDTSRTYVVGKVATKVIHLVQDTEKAMWKGIEQIAPKKRISDIGDAIEKFLAPMGYGIVQDFTGHGIGRIFHEDPIIPHYSQRKLCDIMRPGMIFTVEPMVNLGSYKVRIDKKDGWTVTTEDGSLSAQFEHTCLVTENGVEVLTQLD